MSRVPAVSWATAHFSFTEDPPQLHTFYFLTPLTTMINRLHPLASAIVFALVASSALTTIGATAAEVVQPSEDNHPAPVFLRDGKTKNGSPAIQNQQHHGRRLPQCCAADPPACRRGGTPECCPEDGSWTCPNRKGRYRCGGVRVKDPTVFTGPCVTSGGGDECCDPCLKPGSSGCPGGPEPISCPPFGEAFASAKCCQSTGRWACFPSDCVDSSSMEVEPTGEPCDDCTNPFVVVCPVGSTTLEREPADCSYKPSQCSPPCCFEWEKITDCELGEALCCPDGTWQCPSERRNKPGIVYKCASGKLWPDDTGFGPICTIPSFRK